MERYSNLGESEPDPVPSDPIEHDLESNFSDEEISDGMDGARFSYLFNFFGVPFCLIPLLKRDNGFSLFHAKQAFLLWVIFFASLLIGWAFLWITLKAMWIFVLGGGFSLALNVLGYQWVMDEKDQNLPLVGPLAETWFQTVTVSAEEDDPE